MSGRIFSRAMDREFLVITMDVRKKAANTWTQEALDQFYTLLEDLENAAGVRGLIFISGKTGHFHAGGDLNLFGRMQERERLAQALETFHQAFLRLGALPFPTLAAIDGHCLGGGLEFALACTARIAKDSKGTLLGLPECNLGILPGGGGTQRLPRLIGYPALDLILKGTVLQASTALQLGIIDRLAPADGDLRKEAIRFLEEILSGMGLPNRQPQDFSSIDQKIESARNEILKTTRGRELPGRRLALHALREGLKLPLEQGLRIEEADFVEAFFTPEAKGSMHTFFLKTMSDQPGQMMTRGFRPTELKKIGVLGFGTMGRGIVIDLLAHTRMEVVVKDISDALEPGRAFVGKILQGMAEKKRVREAPADLMKRLEVVSEYSEGWKGADLVIEAVFEDVRVKDQVYEELCRVVREDCILASNTSSLPLSRIARNVTHPERSAGLHFFSPVWLMQLVEVVQGEKTSRETVDNLLNFASMVRKRPIVCKDSPGFVVNAVLWPYFMDALEFLEMGIPVEEVDNAFLKFGMPVGPIRLIDEMGIDLSYNVIKGKGLEQETLKNIVGAGRFGLKKSGKGFFLKEGGVDPEVVPLIHLRERREMSPGEMQTRVLADMATVGKDLLDRGIVSDPRMIDIGLIWGAGFPADKGGPLKWADLTGLSRERFGRVFYE